MTAKKKRFESEPALAFPKEIHYLDEDSDENEENIKLPLRTCIASRDKKSKDLLLRFVVSPENKVIPDLKGTLPGRGVWVTPQRSSIEEAIKRRAFNRMFKADVLVSPELPDFVEQLLRRSAIERLSIANKAGLVVTGFVRIVEAIKRREILTILHAEAAAMGGQTKLDSKLAANSGKIAIPYKIRFTSEEFSLATGSMNVIHAGLKDGGATQSFLQALDRLSGYSTTN